MVHKYNSQPSKPVKINTPPPVALFNRGVHWPKTFPGPAQFLELAGQDSGGAEEFQNLARPSNQSSWAKAGLAGLFYYFSIVFNLSLSLFGQIHTQLIKVIILPKNTLIKVIYLGRAGQGKALNFVPLNPSSVHLFIGTNFKAQAWPSPSHDGYSFMILVQANPISWSYSINRLNFSTYCTSKCRWVQSKL